MKKCNICKIEKPLKYFHENKITKDKYQGYCKQCSTNKRKIRWSKVINNKQKSKLLYTPQHIDVYNLENYYKPLETICGVYSFINYYNEVRYIGCGAWIGPEVQRHIYKLRKNNGAKNFNKNGTII